MHFTSTSASWLSMVERFFRVITTERPRRGVFTSVGSVQFISENKAYEKMTVPKDRLPDLTIIGRVVWAAGWI